MIHNTTKAILRTLAFALTICATTSAWAESESALYVTVADTSVTIANYSSSSTLDQSTPGASNAKICIASGLDSALVASGMRVRVDSFEFVRDYNGTVAAPSKIRIVVDGITHTSDTRTETSLSLKHQNNQSKPISYGCKYVFPSTPYLKVGESYDVKFLDSNGNTQSSIRYEVVNNSAELITGISASGWRPAYTMSGTIITTVNKANNDTITSADAGGLIVVNGGTVNVSGSATATGLIVSSNTTLHFEEGATLTLSGPLYVESGNTLAISSADTISGFQTFITAGSVCATAGAIVSSDASYSASATSITVALTSYSNEASVSGVVDWSSIVWTDGTWHDGSPATLTLTDDATINFDNTYSMSSLTLTGAHTVTLVYTKTPTISSGISCENSATCKIKIPATSTDWPLGSAWTVPNNGVTYILAGSADSGSLTSCSGLITVNGKLETTGYLNLSAENKIAATGELKVLDGRTRMNTGENGGGICGTLTIESGAVFENARAGDGLNYGGSPTVNVYGTLNMASTRWTLGGATLNFYAGSTVTGTGQPNGATTHGALDSNSVKTFYVLAKAGQDEVNLSATLRPRAAQTFNIAANVTVNCTGKDSNEYTNPISITGSGKFKIATGASFTSKVTFNVTSPATLELAGGTIAGAIQGTGNLSVASGTYEPSFSSFSGAVSVSGSGTVLTLTPTQVTAVSGITVGSGSTLKIKVTAAEILHGYDASSKVSNSGGTVMFVDSSGTEITENVSGDGETLNPPVKIWRDGTWAEAVASGDNAKLYISQNSTLTVSEALSLGAVTVVKEGEDDVTLTISGAGALTTGGWTIPAGVTVVTADGMEIAGDVTGGGVINVPANTTLTMDGVTTPGDTLADRVKVAVSGTLKTKGTTTLSAANTSAAGSLIEVVADTTTLSSAWQGIAGDITVDNEATLSFWDSLSGGNNYYYNHINPDGSSTIDVSGTIVLGSSRFLNFGAGIAVVMHSGSSITGGRTDYGSLGWTGNCSLTVDGDATISAPIRINTGVSPTFTIRNNATLTIDKAFISSDGNYGTSGGSITKAGAGTLDLTAITPTKPITIEAGTVVADVVPTAQVTINENCTFELKDCAWTGNVFSGSGTLYLHHTNTSTDRYNHSVSGSSFSGRLKIGTPSGKKAYFNDNPQTQLTGRPELVLELGTQGEQGQLWVGAKAKDKYFNVKNLSGWGYVVPWSSAQGVHYFETVQNDNTVFSGAFADWNGSEIGTGNYKTGLTVKGGDTVKSLTLTAANTTTGPLAIQDSGKVIFSGSGSWLNGTTTVKSGGVLESQRDAQVVGNLTLEDGSTLSFAEGYSLQVGAITLPASGAVTLDVSKLTLSHSGTTLMTFSTAPSASDVVNKMTVSGAALKLENSTLKAYPVATVTTFGSDAVVAYSSVQEAIDNASALNGQYVTAYQSETVTAAGQILLKIADGAVVTLNSSKAGYAYDGGTYIDDGIYMFSDNVQVAATFKWKTSVASGSWGTIDNWTSDDGSVSRMPGSLDTVIFESAALVETPVGGFSFAALQANASVTIKRDKLAIDDRLTRTVSAHGAISGTGSGSLTLNDGVNLANASGASLSIGVPVTVAGATALTVAEGVAASFTGSGTLTLDALTSTSIVGDGWTGTVKLPAITTGPIIFNNYGTTGSTVYLTSMSGAWIKADSTTINPKLYLAGNMTLSSMSPKSYTFAEIDGPGDLSFASSADSQPTAINITKVAKGYSGTISSTLTTPVTIDELKLSSLPACDDKVLAVGGTGPISLYVSNIKIGVNEESLPAKYKLERRHVGEEGDGFYVYYYGTIFSVY